MDVKILLISVGGSSEPIVYVLKERRPQCVIFFSSASSRGLVESKILPELGYYPRCGHVVTPDAENVGICTFELLKKVPEEIRKLGGTCDWPAYCGYTGGTKAMSAALVWAASGFPCELLYVGGRQRTRNGVGIVETGSERLICLENPWNKIGWFEMRTAFELFNRAQYGNAANLLQGLLEKMSDCETRTAVRFLADLFSALSDWDAFLHAKALKRFEKAVRELPQIRRLILDEFPACQNLLDWLPPARDHLRSLKISSDGTLSLTDALIEDLLANALRRARQEMKYEDATARLYSLFEKEVKRRLQKKYGLDNSSCDWASIPEAIRADYQPYMNPETGRCAFGLKASFRLLTELGEDEVATRYLQKEKSLSFALRKRNQSILGHGAKSISKTEFDELLMLILYVLNRNENDLFRVPEIGESVNGGLTESGG